ncbi:MAG: hypothetical protein LBU32_07825 [Clostridiales bacterium]|jgi:hypothetical protein|nr:hypothetical protein [Clostridiales bacterium]
MERKGIATDHGDTNREIAVSSLQIRRLRARIKQWLKTESENTAPPTLSEVLSEILQRGAENPSRPKIANLKIAARALNFLTENNITDIASLNVKVSAMTGRLRSVSEKLKKVERRLKTLDRHILQIENYNSNREHKARYEKLYAEHEAAGQTKGFFAERKAQKLWMRRRIITGRTAPKSRFAMPPSSICATCFNSSLTRRNCRR